LPTFDDSKWELAVEIPAPCGELKSGFFLPPVKVCKTIAPRKMFSPRSGVYLYDFGQNFSGWARLRVRGPRGTKIKLRYGELLNDDGTLNVAPNRTAEATDVYILKGEGEETYEPHFTYHGFRYIELTGYPGVPSLGSLEGCFVHSDVGEVGNFFCSNQLVNKIHENIRWGQLSNLMSIPTDCPQRDERMGWLGDAHLTAEEAMYNFYMFGFYKKWLLDLRKAQKENGSLPDVVPPYWSIYPADPAWGAACVILPWELYLFYGDRDILVENYSMMKRWVEYLLSQLNDDGILPIGKYGDWCPPGHVMSVDIPVEFVSTWYLYYSLHLLSLIAHEVRNYDDEEKFAKKASFVRQAINKKFLGEKDFYGEVDEWFTVFIPAGEISEEERIKRKQNLHRSFARRSQTAQVLVLFSGIVPDEKKEKVLKELVEDITVPCGYHLNTGIIGTKYVLDVLSDFGHVDLAFKLLTQTSYPSWGYMIKESATTLWERWEYLTEGGMNSQNHIMLGTVGAYLYKYLAGIKPNPRSPGWKEFVVKPYPVDGLQFVRASLHTLRGLIRVEWEKAPEGLFIRVSVPMGAQAKIFLPTLGLDKVMVKEGGATIWICEEPLKNQCGISFSHREKDRIVFNVESGDYTFEVSRLE
jgi:alpha-L-rhamnosidase